jgi:hypothetical protein
MNKLIPNRINIVVAASLAGILSAPAFAGQREIELQTDTLFDGIKLHTGAGFYAVRVGSNGKITQVGLANQFNTKGANVKIVC